MRNYNLKSREKFEPGPGFEPQNSRSLAWHSTIWAILVIEILDDVKNGGTITLEIKWTFSPKPEADQVEGIRSEKLNFIDFLNDIVNRNK